MGSKSFTNQTSDRGLISRIHKEWGNLTPKEQIISQKMGCWTKMVLKKKKYLERLLTFFVTREMKIKTVLRVHLTPSEQLTARKPQQMLAMMQWSSLTHPWSERAIQQLLGKSLWKFLEKLKVELPCNPTEPLLRTYLQSPESTHHNDTYAAIFIVTIARKQNQPRWPSPDDWVKKVCK